MIVVDTVLDRMIALGYGNAGQAVRRRLWDRCQSALERAGTSSDPGLCPWPA